MPKKNQYMFCSILPYLELKYNSLIYHILDKNNCTPSTFSLLIISSVQYIKCVNLNFNSFIRH